MNSQVKKQLDKLEAVALLMQHEAEVALKICRKAKIEMEGVSTPSLQTGSDKAIAQIIAKRNAKLFKAHKSLRHA